MTNDVFPRPVSVKLVDHRIVAAELLGFTTLPVNRRNEGDMKVYIYGICETFEGNYVARTLDNIKVRNH